MKKKIIKVALVAAFAIVAGYNVYNSQKTDVMSDLALANVEALAKSENNGNGNCPYSGYACVVRWSNGAIDYFPGLSPNDRH